ncbi:hypothetical protein CH53_3014 [Yersinia intermedia]|nr:hypothetical protein CH53_3014 [Yersinia intermedia]
MKRRTRINFTPEQKAIIWDRYKQGDPLHDIARMFDKYHPSNGLCFPVSYGLTEVGSPGDSWFSCISGKVLFFSWNVCRTANHQDQALQPIHEKCDCIIGLRYVGKNRPEIGTSSLYCADYPALLALQLLLSSLWLSQIGRGYRFSVVTPLLCSKQNCHMQHLIL